MSNLTRDELLLTFSTSSGFIFTFPSIWLLYSEASVGKKAKDSSCLNEYLQEKWLR